MKVCGIICEYNPFHNGHLYQFRRIREMGYDFIVCLMSGHFTQRGLPACRDKWERALWALRGGADVVLELPVAYALQSAEGFAAGGVRILHGLGVVDGLCFGCETDDLARLFQTASFLLSPDEAFQENLRGFLKKGCSFAAARALAIEKSLGTQAAHLLCSPNAILGIEYLKALKKYKSNISPVVIERRYAPYHSQDIEGEIASATAIREAIAKKDERFLQALPAHTAKSLQQEFVESSAFSALILCALRRLGSPGIALLPDISEGLENRIFSAAQKSATFEEFCQTAKSARYPLSRIQRIAMYALLGLTKEDISLANCPTAPLYARLLGFRKSAAPLLARIGQESRIPLLRRAADYKTLAQENRLFALDLAASDVYALCCGQKSGGQDFTRPLILI